MLSRREMLLGLGTGAAALGLGRLGFAKRTLLPRPEHSGIKHIVVVMVENRSFDHLLGWLPGADGMQAGLVYEDAAGTPFSTFHLAPDYQGCAFTDPDHSNPGGIIQLSDGACDGWLLTSDQFSIGYYEESDLPFLARAAREWTVCDRYFTAWMGPTYPNRIYQHCAVTDRFENSFEPSNLPTIWDRLRAAGVSGRYYFSDAPFLALWGSKYVDITRPYASFLADCAAGTLPSVSFVDPRFLGADLGVSGDYHPLSDIRAGETWLYDTYRAVTSSPAWKQTVMIINFDEWGGFFDHVAPPRAVDVSATLEQRGFRVPALVVSPLARRGFVASGIYDHTSILKMIEWRYGLEPLSARDATANNIAEVLDFDRRLLVAGAYDVPDVLSPPCPILL